MIPTISIVMPLYNKERWIKDTTLSILAQTFKDFELIIVDDGSTDNSVDIVKSFNDNRIRLIHQKNSGVSSARNRGILESKGRYIAFIDADDIWRKKHLENLITAFKIYPDIILVANRIDYNKDLDITDSNIKYKYFNYIDYLSKNRFPIHIGSIMVKRCIFKEVGLFYEDMKIGEDVNFIIRVSCNNKCIISNYIGMFYNLVDINGAMLSKKGVVFLPKYLKGVKKDKCSIINNLKLKQFILIEYIKKAYQNRKYPLNIKELTSRDAGEDYKLGVWSKGLYLIVRYMPEFIYGIIRRYKS